MKNRPDLDFDDDLAGDRDLFGIDSEAAPPTPTIGPAPAQTGPGVSEATNAAGAVCSLADAIHAAADVFGQSNTPWAEEFCKWAARFFGDGYVDMEQAYGLWNRLGRLRTYLGTRAHNCRNMGSPRGEQLVKRRDAVICAQLALRAVLMTDRGRDPTLWIERSLYRAHCAEGDDRADSCGLGHRGLKLLGTD